MTSLPTAAEAASEFGVPPLRTGPTIDFAEAGERGVRGLRFLSARGDAYTYDVASPDVGYLIGVNGVNIRGIQGCTKDFLKNAQL